MPLRRSGEDLLRGGPIGDVLEGGGGDDELIGERGPDSYDGGGGQEACQVANDDREAVSCELIITRGS